MPRKSRTQETESNVEPRVTRRSIRSAALPESPAKSPAPSPAKQGRKGKSTGASPRGKNKKLEDIEDEIQVTPTKRGKKTVSSPRGRKSGKVKESAGGDGNEVTDEGKEVDNMEPVLTPSRSRRARAKPAEAEMPSPTRRSSRGAAKAAAAAIESQASAADEIEEDEEMDSSSKGIKRKAEDDDEKTEEKRQKLSEEATESEENKMEVENLEDEEDSTEATIKPSAEATSMDTVKNVEDPQESSKEKELSDNQQINVENKQSSEEPKVDKNVSETVKDDTTEKDSDVPVNEKDTGANEMEVQTKPESENSKLPEHEEIDFVIVEKADLPLHESSEVQDVLPKPILKLENGQVAENRMKQEECPSVQTCSNTTDDSTSTCTSTADMDPLFSRDFLPLKKHTACDNPPGHFTIASYNILADCHAIRGYREWGQYTWTTEAKLAMAHRQIRLHKEFQYLNADIFCLQEVSPAYFSEALLPFMKSQGYEGYFARRGEAEEGEASFYRTSRFTLINSKSIVIQELAQKELSFVELSEEYKELVKERIDAPGVLLALQLKCKRTGTVLTVGNIHVNWGWFKIPDQQSIQIASSIREIVSQAGGIDKPHLLCGDFNSVPTSPGYALARDGYPSDETLDVLKSLKEIYVPSRNEKCSLVDLWWKGFQHPSNSLKSAYFTVQGEEPMSSMFPHDSNIRQVDYIWYSSGSLNLQGVLQTMNSKYMQGGMPNEILPSDHLSTKASFVIS